MIWFVLFIIYIFIIISEFFNVLCCWFYDFVVYKYIGIVRYRDVLNRNVKSGREEGREGGSLVGV